MSTHKLNRILCLAEPRGDAHDVGIVHPAVHGVHGTAALAPDGHVVFAGLGGTIDDDPDAAREAEASVLAEVA